VKITLEMIEAARQVLGDDVPEDTIRAALKAALSAAPGARPSPAIPSLIVTSRLPRAKKVVVPKAVVRARKPRPKR
jgi:hypothetical protein